MQKMTQENLEIQYIATADLLPYARNARTHSDERRKVGGQEQWRGTFEYGRKKLKIIATLENN